MVGLLLTLVPISLGFTSAWGRGGYTSPSPPPHTMMLPHRKEETGVPYCYQRSLPVPQPTNGLPVWSWLSMTITSRQGEWNIP